LLNELLMKKIIYFLVFLTAIFLIAANLSPPKEVMVDNEYTAASNDALLVVNVELATPIVSDLAIRGPSTQFVNFELSNSTVCAVNVDRQEMITNENLKYDFSESTYTYNWTTTSSGFYPLSNTCPHDVAMPLKISMTTSASSFENGMMTNARNRTHYKTEFAG
jgi:hypothetical protein